MSVADRVIRWSTALAVAGVCRGRGGGVVRACLGAGGCAADPADKAEVYRQLGLTLTYDPAARRVKAEARPESIM